MWDGCTLCAFTSRIGGELLCGWAEMVWREPALQPYACQNRRPQLCVWVSWLTISDFWIHAALYNFLEQSVKQEAEWVRIVDNNFFCMQMKCERLLLIVQLQPVVSKAWYVLLNQRFSTFVVRWTSKYDKDINKGHPSIHIKDSYIFSSINNQFLL